MFTSTFDLNLSEASIVEIIDVFVDFKRKSNPADGMRWFGSGANLNRILKIMA